MVTIAFGYKKMSASPTGKNLLTFTDNDNFVQIQFVAKLFCSKTIGRNEKQISIVCILYMQRRNGLERTLSI